MRDPARGTASTDEDGRDVDDAMGRLIQTMIARSRDDDGSIDDGVDPADYARARATTTMVAVTLPRVLETIARATVGAMEAREAETRVTLARALETSRRRCDALETRSRDAEDALDGARERLGREMLRRGGDEDEHGEGATRESLRNELELYREACRRYRKRAEHFEALYRETRGGAGEKGVPAATRTASGRGAVDAERAAARRRRRGDAFERTAEEEIDRRTFKRAIRENPENKTYEDELWGAQTQRAEADDRARGGRWDRRRETDSDADDDDAPPPPLDRIFLDSNDRADDREREMASRDGGERAARGRRDSTSTPSGANKVRKNKRLSDNAPTNPDRVHDERRKVVKHVDVVRKKSEREALDAYVCDECRTFYDAMMPGKDRATIKCPHAPSTAGKMTTKQKLANSRHRAKWAPEPAPRGFWNLALTPPEKENCENRARAD